MYTEKSLNSTGVLGAKSGLKLWQILMFGCYGTWQMGIVYYSAAVLSLGDGAFLSKHTTVSGIIIALGYIISSVIIRIFHQYAVPILRVLMTVSLACSVLLYVPFDEKISTVLFLIQLFSCVFMVCGYATVEITRFRPHDELVRMSFSIIALGLTAAVLHFEPLKLPFSVFNTIGCVCQLLILIFLFSVPSKSAAEADSRISDSRRPAIEVAGFLFLSFGSGLLICFSNTVAQTCIHGVSILYLSAVPGVLLALLLLRFKVNPAKIFKYCLLIQTFGFVMALASSEIPFMLPLSCVCLGLSFIGGEFFVYYGIFLFSRYRSRRLVPMAAMSAFIAAGISMVLCEVFESRPKLLYAVYAVVALLFVFIYERLEPYYAYDYSLNTERLNSNSNLEDCCATAKENEPESGDCSDALLQTADGAATEKSDLSEDVADGVFSILTVQEERLAQLLLQGYTEGAISEWMNISINTQKSYRKSVYQKLNIHSKRELFEIVKNSRE